METLLTILVLALLALLFAMWWLLAVVSKQRDAFRKNADDAIAQTQRALELNAKLLARH